MRYAVIISFVPPANILDKRTEAITETVKTLKEAQKYKSLIDDTVAEARVFDRVTCKIVEKWK